MLNKLKPILVSIILLICLTNLIILDINFFTKDKNVNTSDGISSPIITPQPTEQKCSENCTSQVPLVTPTTSPAAKPIYNNQAQATSQVKDFMISLGSGTGQSSDWTDVPGVGATINSGNYGEIKNVFFEASLVLPTANDIVSLRLYNVTDKHPVWYSQIDSNGELTEFLSSQQIKLDSGNKFYKVQMKTLLNDQPVNLVQSRIHIITN